jgi:glycosyltransferase involved in cell wall biosynthesis
MRIAYITSGAAGMYCGSCLHDNTLAAALHGLGHDALLIPTYTPIRTDEPDVSQPRVFFGGINVYLQEKFALFRHTPWFLDRLLDGRPLLNWVSRFAVKTEAASLGALTVSMLEGEHGHQKKEVDKLVAWLAEEIKPDIVQLSNVLMSGLVQRLREKLRMPVLAALQGDDIYLDSLPDAYRARCLELVKAHCRQIDGFIATSRYYADFMAGYLDIPHERIAVVYPGLNLGGHGPAGPRAAGPFTIGYFARICPEKGLQVLVEAFRRLRQLPGTPPCRLRASGWLGAHRRDFLAEQQARLAASGLAADFEYVDSPDHASKVRFLQSLDVLSVPTVYREPKGLYVLEAWANGIPVVQPRHGSFPELIEATGGGILVPPEDPEALAHALRRLADHPEERAALGASGRQAVVKSFHARAMAEATVRVYEDYLT